MRIRTPQRYLRNRTVPWFPVALVVSLAGCGTAVTPSSSPYTPVCSAAAGPSTSRVAPPWRGLPLCTHAKSGTRGDPINIAFEGTREQVESAFRRIGWVQADPLSLRNDLQLARATIAHRLYPRAPVSALYVFRRAEDMAFERELGSVASRDHARLWDTHRVDPSTHQELWIGDASRDVAIKILRKHHFPIGTTHRIDPGLDRERARIVSSLQRVSANRFVIMLPGTGQTSVGRNAEDDRFRTDGRVALVVLRP